MARREYVQTTQFTRSQIEDVMNYNLAIYKSDSTRDPYWLEEELDAVKTTIKLVKFITSTSASTILGLAKAVISMYKDLSSADGKFFAETARQGYLGLNTALNPFKHHPECEAVEITYGVLVDQDYDVKIVSSEGISIDRIKINGVWNS